MGLSPRVVFAGAGVAGICAGAYFLIPQFLSHRRTEFSIWFHPDDLADSRMPTDYFVKLWGVSHMTYGPFLERPLLLQRERA
jgi:hypothetical protein